ncbi:hypothetical protein D3869_01360 [Azospirillum brasilense]|uniref:Peptidase S74 domain-containing protein n=2 Tax=Azospirillum brasilense TaxID=192 RepID=A0A4D8R4F3_AZOBR|nr:hypothetical protein D3869_01360 [Azospirillum brasilense]
MNGTAVEFGGDDATVLDCMILGFGLGIDTRGRARPGIRHVGIDAHSGLHVPGGFDIGRIASVHAWPYLTAYTPGVGAGSEAAAAPLRRTGYGFRVSNDVSGPADWFSLVDCFSYGHVQGYVLHNVSNVTLIRCQADYTSPDTGILGGFFITGTSAYVSLLNCTGIGQGVDTITIDTVGNSHGHATVSVTGGRFGGGIRVKNGRGLIVGNEIFTNTKGVIVEAGGGGTLIEGNVFEDITDPLDIAASVLGTVEIWGNVFIRCADELGNMVAVADRRGLAVGRGGQVALRSVFSGGVYGDVAGIRGHLVDGTLANAAGALVLQSRRMGVLVDRWQIHHDGHLQPMVDNALDIGGASLRARNIYGASGVVNTSDRAAKQDFAPIDDALLDAWGGVSWRLYRFRDAVEAKGDGARIHAGAIAQDVHDVLAAQGLNPWRYGLLCRDDLTEPTGDPDGSVRVTGERWGLRYDQCLVVEAAYQRRRADLSDSRITALEQRVFA